MPMIRFLCAALSFLALLPQSAQAQTTTQARDTGVSGVWILANISYAGMRAQERQTDVWLILAFIFGLPGTLLSYFVVEKGGERAYGIDLPRRERRRASEAAATAESRNSAPEGNAPDVRATRA